MKSFLIIGTVLILLLALLSLLAGLFARRERPGPVIAPYDEMKRMIREGSVEMGPGVQLPELPPPMPLSDVFELEDSNTFYLEIADNVGHTMARVGPDGLNASESAVTHVYSLEGEVMNGGFDQYFFNSGGDHASEALRWLETLGATRTAGIVRRAISVFGEEGPSPDREVRWRQMDRWSNAERDTLHALDLEFFDYPDDVPGLVMAYCREHRAHFERRPE